MASAEEEGPHRTMTYTTELDSKISYSVSFACIRGVEERRIWWQMQMLVLMGTPGHMHLKTSYIISNVQRAQHVSTVQECVLATANLTYPDRTNKLWRWWWGGITELQ
jgi:hypothetical protein